MGAVVPWLCTFKQPQREPEAGNHTPLVLTTTLQDSCIKGPFLRRPYLGLPTARLTLLTSPCSARQSARGSVVE